MGNKRPLSVKKVKEALEKSNGYVTPAANTLGRCRQTLSKYIENNQDLIDFQESLFQHRGDLYENTLHKMALGEVAYEKTIADDKGKVTVVYYRQAPHYPALRTALEMTKRYTPTSKMDHTTNGKDIKLDIAGVSMKPYETKDK